MKNLLDLHTHTLSSGHAYSTLRENIAAAKEKGLTYYGVSDHGPTMPDGAKQFYFNNLRVIPKVIDGVKILKGAELNILDKEGNIDLTNEDLKGLDYVIASIHGPCFHSNDVEGNTIAICNAMKNPYLKIIGHPDDARYPLDYERVVKAAKEHHVLLEVNNSSLQPNGYRIGAKDNYKIMLALCAKYDVPVICNSDAHISFSVGFIDTALSLLEELNFPKHLIVNFNSNLIEEYVLSEKPSIKA